MILQENLLKFQFFRSNEAPIQHYDLLANILKEGKKWVEVVSEKLFLNLHKLTKNWLRLEKAEVGGWR